MRLIQQDTREAQIIWEKKLCRSTIVLKCPEHIRDWAQTQTWAWRDFFQFLQQCNSMLASQWGQDASGTHVCGLTYWVGSMSWDRGVRSNIETHEAPQSKAATTLSSAAAASLTWAFLSFIVGKNDLERKKREWFRLFLQGVLKSSSVRH